MERIEWGGRKPNLFGQAEAPLGGVGAERSLTTEQRSLARLPKLVPSARLKIRSSLDSKLCGLSHY